MVGPSLQQSLRKHPSARSTTEYPLGNIFGQESMGSSLARAKRSAANTEVAKEDCSW